MSFENLNSLSEAFVVVPEMLSPNADIQVDQTTIAIKVSDSFFEAMLGGEGAAIFTTVLQRSINLPNVWAVSLFVQQKELRLLLDLSDLYILRCLQEALEVGQISMLLISQEYVCKTIQLELDEVVTTDLLRLATTAHNFSEKMRFAELMCLASMLANKESFPVSIPGQQPDVVWAYPVLTPHSALAFKEFVSDAVTSVTAG